MIDNESQITSKFNSTFSRLFTLATNVFLKVKLVYSNQQLTLIKTQVTRMIEENKYNIQFLQVCNNSFQNFIIKIEKTFVIKIIENKSNKYEEDFDINYLKYVKQMKLQFNQNDVKKRTKNLNRKKIDYAITFLKNIAKFN